MKKLLTLGLAVAALAGSAGATCAAQLRPGMLTRVDDAWRDCHRWDRHHHQCRDADWDRNRWNEHDWYGRGACHNGHDHYLDPRGHWRECR
jgi:hypothetical protein